MPQVQLPIFPAGVTHINSEVSFEERDGKVYYFNGHLPVFVHEKSALATFRLFSTQLVINGNATQAEISRAFGVPLVTVKRYVKLYRESGAAAFFAPAKKRSGSKLTAEVCQQVQGLLEQGLTVPEVGRELFSMLEGFYPLESIFLLLALMALARVPSLEALRYVAPGESGKLIGLDRIPEVG